MKLDGWQRAIIIASLVAVGFWMLAVYLAVGKL